MLETTLLPPNPGLSPQEGGCGAVRVRHKLLSQQGASDSASVLPREDQQKHGTAAGFYFYASIQAKIFKHPNSPRRTSLHLVPDLLMKTLKKQIHPITVTQHNPRQPTVS